MPSELEELVGFIAHPNPQIREVATENLIPFSTSQPAIFKTNDLLPVKHLSFLLNDQPKIAEHATTILINLTADHAVLERLTADDKFINVVVSNVTAPAEPNANLLSMLLANLAKWEGLIKKIVDKKQSPPEKLGSTELVMNQLMDLFVKGSDGSYNKDANYDYLAYFFADLSKDAGVRQYFLTAQEYDGAMPLTKIRVFTEHESDVRRKGVASTIKNVAFEVSAHKAFLAEDEINILPYILLPIMGSEQYDVEESMAMLPDLQLLPPDKHRDRDNNIVQTHVETLTLLTSTREGRDLMREIKVYPIIRETHLRVDDDGVREACERLVQVLMRDEEEAGDEARGDADEDADEDADRIVEVV